MENERNIRTPNLAGGVGAKSGFSPASQMYVHPELHQEVTAIGGHYMFVKEACLPFRGREVLYLVGYAVFDTTCCGPGGCAYALVPGYVVQWKHSTDQDGRAVSLVEPIRDEAVQREIARCIERVDMVHQVQFQ
jgi:hypothetical protein